MRASSDSAPPATASLRDLLRPLACACLGAALLLAGGCAQRSQAPAAKNYDEPLPVGTEALREVDPALLPAVSMSEAQRADLRRGIANSLAFFKHPQSERWFPISGVSRSQVVRSLKELDRLLASGIDDQQLAREIKARFRVLESVGCDGKGTVLFTGYYTPLWSASLTQDARYRYPIYRRPADLVMPPQGGDPNAGAANRRMPDGTLATYPTRAEIVRTGMLAGHELVWLADPFDAYCVEVQGNAKLRLDDGRLFEIGYNGTNNYPYHGIAEDLVAQGKISKQGLNFFTLRAYFRDHPQEVEADIDKNPRMVFFREVHGGPYGQLSEPVISDVTVATDKHIFPAGAPCLVQTQIADPSGTRAGYVALRLDQDTGGGVRVAGHVDLYMGEGDAAERRAGSQYYEGRLFYLILRE